MTELVNVIDETFNFNEKTIRVLGTYEKPWFIAKDICDILELTNITNALRNIPEKWMTLQNVKSSYNTQSMVVISEPAVYKLIMRSNKKVSQKFQEVVCEEILPSIRRTGEFKLQTMLDEKNKEIEKLSKIVYKKQKQKYDQSHSAYIISNPDIKDCHKVGVTNDRNRRLTDLGPGAPLNYKIEHSRTLTSTLDRSIIENALLSVFYECREINDTIGSHKREWIRGIPLKTLINELDFWVDTLESRKFHNPDYKEYKPIEDIVEVDINKKETNAKVKIENVQKRERKFWSEEEVELFKEATDKIGKKWIKILEEYPIFKENGRNNIDLKDKYRNIFGDRSKEGSAREM